MMLVLERMKVVIEPSAAVGLAVALFHEWFRGMVERESEDEGWHLGIVFSGGNTSLEALGEMFAPQHKKEAERQEGMVGLDGDRVAEGAAG
jgi:threonine dehydratase